MYALGPHGKRAIEELEAAVLSVFDDVEYRERDVLKRPTEGPRYPIHGLADEYLTGRAHVHVHSRIVGHKDELCAVFGYRFDPESERDWRCACGDREAVYREAPERDMAVFVDIPEFVEYPEGMLGISWAPLIRLRSLKDCLSCRRDSSSDARFWVYPLSIARWTRLQDGEAGVFRGFATVFFHELPREVFERRTKVVQEFSYGRKEACVRHTEALAAHDKGAIGVGVGVELTAEVAKVRAVIGNQHRLDSLEVLLGAYEPVPDQD